MSNDPTEAKKLKLLIVAPSLGILGGQAVQAARLLSHLRSEESLLVELLPVNPQLPGVLHQLQKIKYVRTAVTSLAYILSLLWRVPQFDVLHIFSASYFSFVLAPTPAILIGRLYGRKVLLNYHSGEALDHLQRWRSAISTLKLAHSFIVPSEYLVEIFARFNLKPKAIFNQIDINRFHFRERSSLRPLFLSNRNLESHYGVDKVLRAFALIQKEIPDARLRVVGDGSQRRSLEKLAADLGLTNITFDGQVPPEKIADVYDGADVFLNGSEIDNQPLSLLEAFASGLPIVTTDAGGIPYIVTDRVSGMLVPCGDYVQMAQRAIELLSDPQLVTRIVENGRHECSRYSWDILRDEWMKEYTRLGNLKGASSESTQELSSGSASRNG